MTRAHVLAWRADLEGRALAGATIRRKLAALASLSTICRIQRYSRGQSRARGQAASDRGNEGKTPILGDHQANALLKAPDARTLKDLRDRAIQTVLLYHGLRREEAAHLMTCHLVERRALSA